MRNAALVACRTMTLNLHVAMLPARSLTVLVTMFVPTGNVEPDAGVAMVAPTPEQLSNAVAARK